MSFTDLDISLSTILLVVFLPIVTIGAWIIIEQKRAIKVHEKNSVKMRRTIRRMKGEVNNVN